MTKQPTADLLVPTLETSTPPEFRVKDVKSAHEIYMKLKDADNLSAESRAMIQAVLDGQPPYDENDLVATNQGHRANINFGELDAMVDSSMAGYIDLISSVETLIRFRTKHGKIEERTEWEDIVSEEFSRMLRNWDRFDFNFINLARMFIVNGVGFCYFDDSFDWRWRVTGLGDLLIPRRTQATEDDIEVACCVRSFQAHQLYRYIKDEARATELGWNVPAVKKAILGASSGRNMETEWERFQEELKNNDLFVGTANASEIKAVHQWVHEFDGTVSHSIFLESSAPSAEDKFLYRKSKKFHKMSQALVGFTYGVGTNGYYHSIRGLGYKVFPAIQMSNRLRSQMIDGAMLSSSVMLQPQNEDALQNFQLTYYGPYAILAPGVDLVDRTIPNASNSTLPILGDMGRILTAKSGQYQSSVVEDKREKTRYEVQVEAQQGARLSVASLSLFYNPLERLLKEVLRRACSENYHPADPGGQAVREFKVRCFERGVPTEVIHKVDIARVTVVRAIGSGSEAMRQTVLDELSQLAPAFDEVGRTNALRDKVAARIGYDRANRYIQPANAEARTTEDEKRAFLEHTSMKVGVAAPVFPNDIHSAHARVHLGELSSIAGLLEQDPTQIPQQIDYLVTLLEHTTAHVEALNDNPILVQEAAGFRKSLQQIGEIATNGQRHVEKLRRQQAQQTEAGQAPEGGQLPGSADLDVKLRNRLAEHNVKMQTIREAADLKMQLALQAAQQKLALRDAEVATKIRATGAIPDRV